MRISDWSSDVSSSDLVDFARQITSVRLLDRLARAIAFARADRIIVTDADRRAPQRRRQLFAIFQLVHVEEGEAIVVHLVAGEEIAAKRAKPAGARRISRAVDVEIGGLGKGPGVRDIRPVIRAPTYRLVAIRIARADLDRVEPARLDVIERKSVV